MMSFHDSPSADSAQRKSTNDSDFSLQQNNKTGGLSPSHSLTESVRSDETSRKFRRQLVVENIPVNVRDVEYAVRGAVVLKALEMEQVLHRNASAFPFKKLIYCNIGNPQAVGQPFLTHIRQLTSILENPVLLASKFKSGLQYPRDIRKRAKKYLDILGSSGAYTHSKGALGFRQIIANWFFIRDGHKCNQESIFMTDGASSAVNVVLQFLISKPNTGIMIPIPQYPLYNATITLLKGNSVGYYLNEDKGWGLSRHALEDALAEAKVRGLKTEAIVVINPGNPSGSVLSEEDMIDVIQLCERESLVLLADEVYQENIHLENKKFIPFRKLVLDLRSPVQVISFHSSSKGYYGECGHRGGLMQLENVDDEVLNCLYKLQSVKLCPNTLGQAIMTTVLSPPSPTDESFETFDREKRSIVNNLARKSKLVHSLLNSMTGVSCQPIEGALYAMPNITIPAGGIRIAAEKKQEPDAWFCMQLLEKTGIVAVPGSGFGQAPGSYHIRLTILPTEEELEECLYRMRLFIEQLNLEFAQ